MKWILPLAAGLIVSPSLAAGPTVIGDYIEARTCDVWTGPCFSNSEINITGEMALMAWHVRQGVWESSEITGLSLAVALRAEGTLSTPNEGKVRAVIYVDERASESQEKALLSMARSLAGKYLQNVVDVRRVSIRYEREEAAAALKVGEVARLRTQALDLCCDAHCGNEVVAYPSLSRADHVACAKSLEHHYSGPGLDARWSDPMKRSAMLGHFSL